MLSMEELQSLANAVSECCISDVAGRMSPFSVRFFDAHHVDEDFSEIEISPALGELVGGKDDGDKIFDPPTIDLEALRGLFDTNDEQFNFSYTPCQGGAEDEDEHIEIWSEKVLVKIFFVPQSTEETSWILDINGKETSWREPA